MRPAARSVGECAGVNDMVAAPRGFVVSPHGRLSCAPPLSACGWSRQAGSSCCRSLRSDFPRGVRSSLEEPADSSGPFALHEVFSPAARETAQAARVAKFLEMFRLNPSEPYRTVHARLLRQAHPDKRGEFTCRHCTEELLDMRCAVEKLRCADPQEEGRTVTDLVVLGGLLLAAGAVTQWLGGGPRPAPPCKRPRRGRCDGGARGLHRASPLQNLSCDGAIKRR